MGSARRRGREIALQVLSAIDANPELPAPHALALYFEHLADGEDEDPAARSEPADRTYAETLVREVTARREELDELLGRVSRNWRVERMARVDRSILRLAVYELRHVPDVPARVTINEAIELAKRFGAAEAPPFVNGILDAAVRALEIKK
jgi:N utilization substance protein B